MSHLESANTTSTVSGREAECWSVGVPVNVNVNVNVNANVDADLQQCCVAL